ncbi:hypothetical protein PUN4_360009 [Paraburkholderia unamae]|uniref:hypothetical protein n=1 Tax=Paraburkholderia unamae TaxID=219649 RepID=UPI001CB3DAE1|nr:hypothetical protein [Paraburkholderia unamae]CAG9260939.1 hypothetical protein PUN4_360009 [Paraburkholderia unamae]
MDYEMKGREGETVPRAQFDQLRRERDALAIMIAAYFGTFINLMGVEPVADCVGWGVDPQSGDGSGTVVYLRQRIIDRKTVFAFRLAPDEGEVARAVLPPFSGERRGAILDGSEYPSWLGACRTEFAAVMDHLRRRA